MQLNKERFLKVANILALIMFILTLLFLIRIFITLGSQGTSNDIASRVKKRYLSLFIVFTSQYLIVGSSLLNFREDHD